MRVTWSGNSVATAPGLIRVTRTSGSSSRRSDSDQPLMPHLVAADTPLPGRAVRPATEETFTMYAATKWGINGWSESLRATELPNHITHAETKQGAEALYRQVDVTAEDIADEILLRPAGQDA